jgi:hypothetical protein
MHTVNYSDMALQQDSYSKGWHCKQYGERHYNLALLLYTIWGPPMTLLYSANPLTDSTAMGQNMEGERQTRQHIERVGIGSFSNPSVNRDEYTDKSHLVQERFKWLSKRHARVSLHEIQALF